MAATSSDVEYRYSGGATNTSAAACLGGAMSTDASGVVGDDVKNDLFDDVSSSEASAGDTEYRGIYIALKAAAGGDLTDAAAYMSGQSANGGDLIDLAVADEAIGVTIETIANESTAPSGPTFSHPTTYAGGIVIGDLTPGDERGLWVKRTITAGATSGSITDNEITVEGTTV